MNEQEIVFTDRGRRVVLRVPAEKAEVLQKISDTIEEVEAARGRPTAMAMLQALLEGGQSGALHVGMSDTEGAAWLETRVQELLAEASETTAGEG